MGADPGAGGGSSSRAVDARIIGDTLQMRSLKDRVRAVALSEGPVLISGETGTGKELVARTIHELGARAARPFLVINCAAFPDTLLEAELFGHERGAFTGAYTRREGRFVAAHGGTLFLDEVGDMSPGAQAKLLRVLAEGTLEPLGSNQPVKVDVRIMSASNVDLTASIMASRFRQDLYYRLKLFHLRVPPLRDRRDDLPRLVDWFCWELGDRPPPRFSPRAWAALSHHPYPGNVRELRNAIRHALALAGDGDVDLEHLPEDLRGRAPLRGRRSRPSLAEAMCSFERDYILRALQEASWNKTAAAELLGISRKTLWTKLREHEIEGAKAVSDESAEIGSETERSMSTHPRRRE